MKLRHYSGLVILCFLLTLPGCSRAKTVALVIGNSQYTSGPDLINPGDDTRLVSTFLRQSGIQTVLLHNVTRKRFMLALAELRIMAQDSDKVIIYFAGHGVQIFGESYLLPSDAQITSEHVANSAIPLHLLVRAISDKPRQKLIFIDACRENPAFTAFSRVLPRSNSTLSAGLFVLHSAQPGAPATDGNGRYSPFAKAFVQAVQSAGVAVEPLSRRIRLDVIRATSGTQIPWSHSSLLRPAILIETPALVE